MRMNRSLLTGLLISAAFVSTGAAVAGLGFEGGPRYAHVLDVAPVSEPQRIAQRRCETLKPTRRGAKPRERCRTVYETQPTLVGYDVRYRLGSDIGTVRLDRPPMGQRLRFENGVPQVESSG
jgi:uncharacterized protein YcfJ